MIKWTIEKQAEELRQINTLMAREVLTANNRYMSLVSLDTFHRSLLNLNSVFRKENIFTFVTFGALVLFVVATVLLPTTSLSSISSVVAVFVFLLGSLKLLADILETLNDKITSYLSAVERNNPADDDSLRQIRATDKNEVDKLIDQICLKQSKDVWVKERLQSYSIARESRKNIRRVRRVLLYIYYVLFMLMLFFLFWHTELMSNFPALKSFSENSAEIITLWSLVLLLIEIMMKDTIIRLFTNLLGSKVKEYFNFYL